MSGGQNKLHDQEEWDMVIRPKDSAFRLDLKSIWKYRDLLMLFVKRDIVALYKQTILGPLWFIIQPILTTITYYIIFVYIARMTTSGIPPILFFMSGVVLWNYFSDCLIKTSDTFIANAGIFGKVYFPRLIMPLSVTISNMVKLLLQLAMFFVIWCYYYFGKGQLPTMNAAILLLPLLLLLVAGHGFAIGVIISSLTTKYRDLKFLLQFGVQLLMYASAVVYPLSSVPQNYRWILLLNPMTSIIETFRYAVFGTGIFEPVYLVYNLIALLLALLLAAFIFNKVEKSFLDTV